MSFSNIILPKLVMVKLFKNTLVEINPVKNEKTNNKKEPIPVHSIEPLKYLGENKKNVLVLVNYPDHEFLPAPQLEFLSRILLACDMTIKDVSIVNAAIGPFDYENYVRLLFPGSMLVFGIPDHLMPIITSLDYFKPVIEKGMNIIKAPALEIIDGKTGEGNHLKSGLWNCLKQLFNVLPG